MSKIREVKFRPEVNETLVGRLEELLEAAKRGELAGGAFVGPCRDGSIITAYAKSENRLLEIAGLHRLLHRLNLAMDEGSTLDLSK